jgi:hypothetical protein
VIDRVGSVHTPASWLDVAVALAAIFVSVVVATLAVANPMFTFAPIALLGGAREPDYAPPCTRSPPCSRSPLPWRSSA